MRSLDNYCKTLFVMLSLSLILAVQCETECQADDWSAWSYTDSVAIDNTANPATLTDYQIRASLDSANFDFTKAQANGEDLRFADLSTNSLSYWIEEWDTTPGSEQAKIWVKVPLITGSGVTNITMYFGNATAVSASSFEDTFISDNADFEADPPGTSFDSISFWDHISGTGSAGLGTVYWYWYVDDWPGTSPDAEDISVSASRYFTGTQSLYSYVRNSNAYGGDCTGINDPDCRGARHWLYNEDSYRLVADSDTIYIWTTPIVYTTPSRYQWAYGVVIKDGTNSVYARLAHRVWHGSYGWGFSESDTSDINATGADGTTWKRYPISIATLDKTNLNMEIRHLQDSWDYGTAYSYLYWDLLDNIRLRKYSSPEPTVAVAVPVDADGDGSFSNEDCDDNDSSVYPDAPELCDGKDNDCDDVIPADEVDVDGDGFMVCDSDCNDLDANINPDAYELPGNAVDENCDGSLGACDPTAEWKNHGQFVRCVAHEVDALIEAGILTEEEGDALITNAAQSDIGKK